MSVQYKDDVTSFILEKLRDTEVFKFVQSLIRESVERIIRPDVAIHVEALSDQKLIFHSMIYHYLMNAGYHAAAEVMQAECYERFLSQDFLANNVEQYDDTAVETSLGQYKLKHGITVTRVSCPKNNGGIVTDLKYQAKPDQEYEQIKEKIRERITTFADEAVERKYELMEASEEINDEQVDEEEVEDERSTGSKSATSSESKTAESEPEVVTGQSGTRRLWSPNAHQLSTDAIIAMSTQPNRPSQLPPLTGNRPKPQLPSIKSFDFDIPQLEKSPSQSSDSPQHSASPSSLAPDTPPKEGVDELSEIESIAGIDQLLESGRSDSISF